MAKIAISWSIGHFHGWGVYGLHLVFGMLRRGITPVLLQVPSSMHLDPLQSRLLLPVIQDSEDFIRFRRAHPGKVVRSPETTPIIHSNGVFEFADVKFAGLPPLGVTFFETATIAAEPIEKAKNMALIVSGSQWNAKILTEKYGLTQVKNVMQGVDTTLFYPSGSRQLLRDRFVIFSGGKLEFRKGQDIVLAAFKWFHARHPEALLLTAWSNRWLDASQPFPKTYVQDLPAADDLTSWLGRYLPPGSFFDVGLVANPLMPAILREADCALFPNRCEGGTNLVAMECMATGLPTILSNNTGHQDLIAVDRCYPLYDQKKVESPMTGQILAEWGESAIEEVVEALEAIYRQREAAKRIGMNGHLFMKNHSWNHQCDRFLDLLI